MTAARRLLLALAVVFAVGTALVTVPARLAPALLGEQPLRLSALTGTLWRGTAARAVVALPGGTLHLGRLRWRVEPLSLLTLSPRVAIDTQWGRQHIALRVRRDGADAVSLRDVAATVDARIIRHWLPVQLRGDVEADLPRLDIAAGLPVWADGRLVWRGAGWLGPAGLQALGTYVLAVQTPQRGTIDGAIETLSGPLIAGGAVAVADGAYRVDARLGPVAALDADLRQALSLVAEPGENGYLLRLDGALAAPQ